MIALDAEHKAKLMHDLNLVVEDAQILLRMTADQVGEEAQAVRERVTQRLGKAKDLQARQSRLLQRSATLRARASAELQQLQPGFAMGDRLLLAGAWLRGNSAYLAATMAVLVVIKPHAVWRITVRAWSLWQSWQTARRWIGQER